MVSIVESHCGRLSAEDMARVVAVADAADEADEKRIVEEEAKIPLLSVERIEDGWLVSYKDDDGHQWRKAFVSGGADMDETAAFERLVWHLKEVLCPDFGRHRMKISFTKDE